ncbi:MAG TPA: chitosanase [Acidimicrobiales bacterium]|nr:chitosanase [Acidimicrobiales bacterium]
MGFRRIVLALAVLAVTGACAGSTDTPPPTTTASAVPTTDASPEGAGGLSADQRRRADQLISAFENSTTEISYDYAENLGDGRGVTAGRAGFTTATCDALAVIERYSETTPTNGLARFVTELGRLCEAASDDTTKLPEADYMRAWAAAAKDPLFRKAQDEIVDREYFEPAMDLADTLDLRLALSRAQLYDTAIQHGAGDDPDGLAAIAARTTADVGTPAKAGERAWLDAFFDARIATLRDPDNAETAEAWRQSTDRVACMQRIAAAGNYSLAAPLRFSVYGDDFVVE